MRSDGTVGSGARIGAGGAAALPRHVAIIMDGNGRWATRRGLPRAVGHRAGAKAVRRVVEAARRRGVGTLTLYAFSSDNWRRPAAEVEALMGLFERYLAEEARRCVENGIRLRVIGRRDRLAASLVSAIDAAEARTGGGTAMELRIAVDYSGRGAILAAIPLLPAGPEPTREALLAA
ncbi:MAG: di-trans,poly-cis-decaprenylcistransferase, partial [Thermoanaerobaculia bacterium]|nr:di-trans,poly-cis-decaprenylcistransferase [Thermoanaerobaculia bacterium]